LSALSAQPAQGKVSVIGASLDLGSGRRGVDMGPSAIRYAGLASRIAKLGHELVDRGNVETAVAEATAVGDEHARFLPEIKATCERIAQLVAESGLTSSLDVVEVNPVLDRENETGKLAVELVASALGARIL
jgi:arginase family enzyme